MTNNKKKILVTGGAGYIGSHTVVALAEANYTPIIIDNFSNAEKSVITALGKIIGEPVKFYEGDCTDVQFMEQVFSFEKDIEGVIHFAAYKAVGESVQEPLKYYENNVYSLILLLKMMQQAKIKNLVFSSSCTVYGEPDALPVTEAFPKKPATSPYGNTKQICEEIIEDVCKKGIDNSGLKAVSLRYFNPVGAHASSLIGELPLGIPNNLVPFVTQTAAGLREKITVFGDDYDTPDGTCIRDYIHVVDLANAHVKALSYLQEQNEEVFYDVFNIGTGQGNSVMELIQAFEKVSGEKLNYEIGARREGDVEKVYANVDKANNKLHWHVEHSLEDSLRDSWNWQKKLSGK